jgi:hypothetical protein
VIEIVNDSDAYETKFPMNVKTQIKKSFLRRCFSANENKMALVSQLQRDQKRKCQTTMDRDLGWKHDIYPINKPIFSGKPRLNQNFKITEESFPTDFFQFIF